MTIEEVTERKKSLDNLISRLVYEFNKSTGLTVSGIEMDYHRAIDCNGKEMVISYKIETVVKL